MSTIEMVDFRKPEAKVVEALMRDRVPVDDGIALRACPEGVRDLVAYDRVLRRRRREAVFEAVVVCAAVLGVIVLGACALVAVLM